MIGEIDFISHTERYIARARDLVSKLGYPKKQLTLPESRLDLLKDFKDILREYVKMSEDSNFDEEPVFLGNSSRPVFTKSRAIEDFRNGSSVEDVKAKYRGVNGKPLPAWNAHVTMGTYDEKRDTPVEIGDVEKISKDEAIDLLKSGVPVSEIHSSYPTSFTPNQLRAFKAWITMGKY